MRPERTRPAIRASRAGRCAFRTGSTGLPGGLLRPCRPGCVRSAGDLGSQQPAIKRFRGVAVTPAIELDPGFEFEGRPPIEDGAAAADLAPAADPLGPLAQLPGTWTGTGFNTIWRP